MQAGVQVVALATLGSLPNGAANGDHCIQVCAPLEIVGHDWIAPQLGRLVEVAKQMPGGYFDRFRRIRPRHDAPSFSGARGAPAGRRPLRCHNTSAIPDPKPGKKVLQGPVSPLDTAFGLG